MKFIVVYIITGLAGLLLTTSEIAGQKPTIDLLPSTHQSKHPEAIVDTGFSSDTLVTVIPFEQPHSYYNDSLKKETGKKERRTIGPDLDSIFQKREAGKSKRGGRKAWFPLIVKHSNPLKLLIYITALK